MDTSSPSTRSNFAARLHESTIPPLSLRRPLIARFLRGVTAGGEIPRTKEPASGPGVGLAVTVTGYETVAVVTAVAVAVAVLIESQR